MPLRYRRRAHGERAFRSIQKQAASGYHLCRISFALSAERERGLAVNVQNVGSHFDHLPRLVSRKPSYAQPPACPPSNPGRHGAPPTPPRARANSLPAVQTEPPHEDTLALYALARSNWFPTVGTNTYQARSCGSETVTMKLSPASSRLSLLSSLG